MVSTINRLCDHTIRSHKDKRDAYLRASNAIQHFIKRKRPSRLVPAQVDPFPLS